MMKTTTRWKMVMGATLFCCATAGEVPAQSVDALLNKLIDKGILTVKEADDLKEESDKNFTQAYSVKSGMPDFVNALNINGDLRGRYEGFFGENPDFVDRNRFRYRLRLGITAQLMDNFEVGLRLTSSEPSGTFGGDPISGNTTLGDNGSKKFVYVDLAYAKWSPLNTSMFNGSVTIGKMENPFVFPSTVLFDRDYTPEGAALQLTSRFGDKQVLKLNAAGFMLDELGADSQDPYMLGAQLRLDSTWSKPLTSSVGIGIFSISNQEQLSNTAVPNVNRGNTRGSNGAPLYNFNPLYADATLTYTLDKFPMYPGAFPISAVGDVIYNPAAPEDNVGYSFGLTLGKAGKKRQWELGYRYALLDRDAWYEEFTESDFGAYYAAQQPNAGVTGAGYSSGTNVRGHVFRLSYSPFNTLTLAGTVFLTELIHENPPGSESGMTRVQVDATLKF